MSFPYVINESIFFYPKPKNKSILWKDHLEPINPEEGEWDTGEGEKAKNNDNRSDRRVVLLLMMMVMMKDDDDDDGDFDEDLDDAKLVHIGLGPCCQTKTAHLGLEMLSQKQKNKNKIARSIPL